MNNRFFNLDKQNQKLILNSAFKAFTDIPYEKASTNVIVKEANISKGKLFYYFKNKETLFNALIDISIHYVKTHYIDLMTFDERDFLKRYSKISMIKKKAYDEEPHLFAFIGYAYLKEAHRMSDDQRRLIKTYQTYAKDKLKENIDTSLFRSDIEAKTVMKLLQYSLDGYQNELTESCKHLNMQKTDMAPYYKDYESFLQTLRKIYYK